MATANAVLSQDAAVKLFLDGSMVVFGEYRFSKGSHIEWRDKTSGKMLEADVLVHTVETVDQSIAVNERLAAGVTPDSRIAELALKKGQRVLVHIEQLMTQKGLVTARGRLQVVATATPAK